MGVLALRELGAPKYFGIRVESYAGDLPPVSCMNDGLQLATGCTFGKGNIRNVGAGEPKARIVSGQRALVVSLTPGARASLAEILERDGEDEAARRVLALPEASVFEASTCEAFAVASRVSAPRP